MSQDDDGDISRYSDQSTLIEIGDTMIVRIERGGRYYAHKQSHSRKHKYSVFDGSGDERAGKARE